jgi:hypothetical protein
MCFGRWCSARRTAQRARIVQSEQVKSAVAVMFCPAVVRKNPSERTASDFSEPPFPLRRPRPHAVATRQLQRPPNVGSEIRCNLSICVLIENDTISPTHTFQSEMRHRCHQVNL